MESRGKGYVVTGMEILFWLLAGLVFYVYLGYGVLVMALDRIRKLLARERALSSDPYEPTVTLVVPAYNEAAWLQEKMENSLSLEYPQDRLKILVVEDGSNDGSEEIINRFPGVIHLHGAERQGKMEALNRAMRRVDSELTVFTDANTMLNREALRELVVCFRDPAVGCVCGEKRVSPGADKDASATGEGLYWRYESRIKKAEAGIGSCIGATGELYAIRTDLYRPETADTLVDDFMISMGIALRGYRIQYAPGAYATETASAGLGEEFKRKIRIAAGNLQSLLRMPGILNPFRAGRLSLQYLSHKFLRTFVVPACFALLIPLNLVLLPERWPLYLLLLSLQLLFYLAAAAGYFLEEGKRGACAPVLFVPLYVVIMNVAAIVGITRFVLGRQPALWEKAARREHKEERGQ